MKLIARIAAVLALLVALVFAIGAFLPERHRARTRLVVKATPQQVWQVITDVSNFPSWRTDVERVQVINPGDNLRWREFGSDGTITYERVAAEPPHKLVTRIADDALPFGGSWTFEITPAAGQGTQVTITEDGTVRNPLFRFMSRFVFGHHYTQKRYLKALARRFGGAAEMQAVD